MGNKQAIKRWLWYFSIPAAAILLYKVYDNFASVSNLLGTLVSIFAPFLGGFVLAFFLYHPSNWLEKFFLKRKGKVWQRLARPLSLVIVYLDLLGVIALLAYLVIPILVSNATDLSTALPGYIDSTQKSLHQLFAPGGLLEDLNLQDMINGLFDRATAMLAGLLTTENLQAAASFVLSIATSLVNVVLAVIISVYMLSGREHLMASCRHVLGLFIKPRMFSPLTHYSKRITTIFYHYFCSALLDALLVGVVVSIGLTIFGVPYAVLLGMAVGLMNMIPYFGAIIGGVAVSLITLLTTNFYTALGVAIFIVVIQQVDANLIQPRIVGDSVGLRPIFVLLSITLFGGLLGFWGVLVAPPLMAIVQMFVRDAIKAKAKREAAEESSQEQAE